MIKAREKNSSAPQRIKNWKMGVWVWTKPIPWGIWVKFKLKGRVKRNQKITTPKRGRAVFTIGQSRGNLENFGGVFLVLKKRVKFVPKRVIPNKSR